MNRKLKFVLLFIAVMCLTASGQNYSKEFGKVEKEEIKLQNYPPDEDAEAVVLFDIYSSKFEEGANSFDVVFERSTRIKILSEAGLKWAEINIPFYQEGEIYERISDVMAFTYNYDADHDQINRTSLKTSNIFDEKINESWNVKKIAIPNVKVGSIIEYKYNIRSPYVFNLRDWEIQWKIPVVYSEYEVRMVPFYNYAYLLQGAKKFDSQSSVIDKNEKLFGTTKYFDYIHKYTMKDIPSFKSEEFITSINDYIIKLDFQLAKIIYPNGATKDIMTTWEEMNKDLLKHSDFYGYIKKSEKLAKKLIDVDSLKLKSEREQFDYILDYVKRNYNWNKYNGKYTSKSPAKFVKEKHGNSADINLFTIGLLNAIGLDAKPVVISTRENGKIKHDYPLSIYFNYVIIMANIDGENITSDATEILSLNNRIPARCINDKGLIVDNGTVEWIGLECTFLSEIQNDFQIEIVNDDIMNTTVSKAATEYDGLSHRNYYGGDNQAILEKLDSKDYTIIDSSIAVQNQFDKEKPYILSYQQSSKPEIVSNKIYISPFLNETISDNPLKQKERTYPIDMTYPKKRVYTTTILIPEGYEVDYTPSEQNYKNELFELTYNAIEEDDKIKVSFNYTFNNSVYTMGDYPKIKAYYDEIVKKGNEKVVLVKKGEGSDEI